MANLTATQKVTQTLNTFQSLGLSIDGQQYNEMKKILFRLIENQHNDTKMACYDVVNHVQANDISELNEKWIDIALRHAQIVINAVELEDK